MTAKTLPAGAYWIGDLCYVLKQPHEWDELLKVSCPKNGPLKAGIHTLPDGREFGLLKTAYGDGRFFDQFNREYSVDSGMIGCINMEDLPEDINVSLANKFCNPFDLGHVSNFKTEIEVRQARGLLFFGTKKEPVVINTQ